MLDQPPSSSLTRLRRSLSRSAATDKSDPELHETEHHNSDNVNDEDAHNDTEANNDTHGLSDTGAWAGNGGGGGNARYGGPPAAPSSGAAGVTGFPTGPPGVAADATLRESKMQRWKEELFAELANKRQEQKMQRTSVSTSSAAPPLHAMR